MAPALAETMARFVPRRVAAWCADGGPEHEQFEGALLFADIKGFTPLTEQLARQGPAGAEALSNILNAYFDLVIRAIVDGGGDVLDFAGDAILALWTHQHLPTAVAGATRVALRLQAQLDGYEPAPGVPLATRIAISAGPLEGAHLGRGRRCYVVSGPPLAQLASAEHEIAASEVGVSKEAWAFLQDRAEGEQRGDGVYRVTAVQLAQTPSPLPVAVSATVERYLTDTLRMRLEAGQDAWLAELRRMTIMFVNLRRTPDLEQPLILAQQIFDHYGVGLYQYLVDDKGTVLIGMLGLPPWTHERDAATALTAAQALHETLRKHHIDASIGLASGRVFCGPVGNHQRQTFTIVGDTMNLAARLMQAADGGILCDQATAAAAASHVACETLEPIVLKGKANPVPVWRPCATAHAQPVGPRLLVGRDREREVLTRAVEDLARGNRSVILIEGEPGLGKSRLLEELGQQARRAGVSVLTAAATPTGQNSPYLALRDVLLQLAGDDPGRAFPEDGERIALLNDVLGWDLPDTPISSSLQGVDRARATRDLLLGLVARTVGEHRSLFIFDDVQWFDTASWDLVLAVSQQTRAYGLALGHRPWSEAPPQAYHALTHVPRVRHLRLTGLDEAQVSNLLARLLETAAVPAELTAFLRTRAAGNPLFIEELLHELKERGAIQDGRFVAPSGPALPQTLEGVLTSRIDRLPPGPALTLKTASVIGRQFAPRTLADVHPIPDDRPAVESHLETLSRWDLTHPETAQTWLFKHVVTQEVAYNLLPFDKRRQLHRGVAQWLEAHHAQELDAWAGILAWHWTQAAVPEKAAAYRNRAGEHAVRAGHWREALAHLTQVPSSPHVSRLMGEAWHGLGEVSNSRQHFLAATSKRRTPLSLFREVLLQLRYRLRAPRQAAAQELEELRDQALTTERLAELDFHDQDMAGAMFWTLAALNTGERLGPSSELARIYGAVCVAAGILGLPWLAHHYGRQGLGIARRLEDPATIAFVLLVTGLQYLVEGSVHRAVHVFEGARQRFHALNMRRRWEESTAVLAVTWGHQGRVDRARPLFEELYASAGASHNLQARGWALAGLLETSLLQGTVPDRADEAARLAGNQQLSRMDRAWLTGALARVHLADGDHRGAYDLARMVTRITQQTWPTGFVSYSGYASAAQVLLHGWRQGQVPWHDLASALADLRRFARVFGLGRPRLWTLQGQILASQGHSRRAVGALRQARDLARARGLAVEEALALSALAGTGDTRSRDQLQRLLATLPVSPAGLHLSA